MKRVFKFMAALTALILPTLGWAELPTAAWTWDGSGATQDGALDSGEIIYKENNHRVTVESKVTGNAFTYAFWVKRGAGNWQDIASLSTSQRGFKLEQKGASQAVTVYEKFDTAGATDTSGINKGDEELAISNSTLTHVVIVNNNGSFTFYLDGTASTTFSNLTAVEAWSDVRSEEKITLLLGIGCSYPYNGGGVERGSGQSWFADVKLYDAAFTAEQVKELYDDYATRAAAKKTYTRTVTAAADWSADAAWTDQNSTTAAAPGTNDDVTLTVNADSTITMNAAATVGALTIGGSAKATFAGDNSLTAASTAVNTDTDVTGITADLGATTIVSDKTLSIGANTTVSIAPGTNGNVGANAGTLRVVGGSSDNPIELSAGTATHDYIGAVNVAENSVLKLHATGGNKTYNITGNGETSHVILTSGQGWGVSNNDKSKIQNCVLEIPQKIPGTDTDNSNFWLTPSKIGENVHLVLNRQLCFENDSNAGTLNILSLSGSGTVIANGSHTVKITDGADQTYSGVIQGTHSVVKEGTGTQIFSGANTYSGTTTVSGGALKLIDAATLGSGAVTVNGNLIYNRNAATTPANTFTGAGTITADACTLDLTTATISDYTGIYATANEGKIILPAGAETAENITAGSSIILKLTEAQMLSGYTAKVPEGITVAFYDNNGAVIEGETVSGNTYTPPLNTWTAKDGSAWGTVANWSNEAVPAAEDSVIISITEDTEITLANAVTVADLTVKGTGTLTIAGAKLTVTSMLVANTSVVAGEDLLAFTDLTIADDKTVTINNSKEFNPGFITGGTFVKNGSGALKFLGDGAPVVDGTVLNIAKGSLVANGQDGGGSADPWFKDATFIFGNGVTMSATNWVLATGTTTLKSDHDFSYTEKPFYSNEDTLNFVVGGTGSVTFNNVRGKNVQVLEGATYGVWDGGGGVISGAGNLKIARDLTLSGANTYTGTTEVPVGITLQVAGLGNLGASGDVNIAEGGKLNIYVTGNTQDHGQAWNRLKGNGTVAYNSNGSWHTFPNVANPIPTTLGVENNLANGLILPEPAQAYKVGSLSGNGAFRVDFGGSADNPRSLEIVQSKNTTFSGGMLTNNNPERLSGFYLSGAEGATEKTLTYSGTTTVAKPMTINASGVLNLTGSWTGNMTNNGILGGTGTIGGALTLASGATIDASTGAITVTGNVTAEGTVNVTLPTGAAAGDDILVCNNAADVVGKLTLADFTLAMTYKPVVADDGKTIELAQVVCLDQDDAVYTSIKAALDAGATAIAVTATTTENVVLPTGVTLTVNKNVTVGSVTDQYGNALTAVGGVYTGPADADYVAQVGENKYLTLDAAKTAAGTTGTIALLKNIMLSQPATGVKTITVKSGVTLDIATGNTTTKSFDDNAIIATEAGATVKLTSGFGYFSITGEGTVQAVGGANFVYGLGGNNTTQNTISANLVIPEEKEFHVRAWTQGTDLGDGNITVNGTIVNSPGTSGQGIDNVAVSLASGKTLAGKGTINAPVTFENGSTIDAKAGAVTVNGEVKGTVAVVASAYGTVLKATSGFDATKFTATAPEGGGVLVVVGNELIYTVKMDSIPESFASNALTQVSNAATTAGVSKVTSIEGADATVDVDGVELFNNVVTVEANAEDTTTGKATVSYAFGVTSITVNADKKAVVKAKVSKLVSGEGAEPTFANGIRVDLYNGSKVIGSATVTAGASEVEITTNDTILKALGEGVSSETLSLTVKATNETQPAN